MEKTHYSDGRRDCDAIMLTWGEVEEALGEPHDGRPDQDEALVRHLLQEGAPEWVAGAEGWVDEYGWGLIGPEVALD